MKRILPFLAIILLVCSGYTFAQEDNRFTSGEVTFEHISEVWSTPAKSQGRTGTCWCFSTVSLIESEAYRLTGQQYELSEMFVVYHAYLEKGERYLRLHGKNNFGQGGLSHDLQYLVPKYGLVRESDYSGIKAEGEGHDHSGLFPEYRDYLNSVLKERKGFPSDYEQQCMAMLNEYLGAPPDTIVVDGKEITPVQFAAEILEFHPDDYIEITSYSYLPFYERGELLVPDNWMRNEEYFNVPLEDFVRIARHALENGYSFVVDLDVSEQTNLGGSAGIKYLPEDIEGTIINQEIRDTQFDTLKTTDDHLMHTTGLAKGSDGLIYFFTKDSGGAERGPYKGFNYISENYFRAKVLAFFLHKDALPDDIRKRLADSN